MQNSNLIHSEAALRSTLNQYASHLEKGATTTKSKKEFNPNKVRRHVEAILTNDVYEEVFRLDRPTTLRES